MSLTGFTTVKEHPQLSHFWSVRQTNLNLTFLDTSSSIVCAWLPSSEGSLMTVGWHIDLRACLRRGRRTISKMPYFMSTWLSLRNSKLASSKFKSTLRVLHSICESSRSALSVGGKRMSAEWWGSAVHAASGLNNGVTACYWLWHNRNHMQSFGITAITCKLKSVLSIRLWCSSYQLADSVLITHMAAECY